MPVYEYVCRGCGAASEVLVRSAGQRTACPACGSGKMDRQFSTFAAHTGASKPAGCPAGGSCPAESCPEGRCPFS